MLGQRFIAHTPVQPFNIKQLELRQYFGPCLAITLSGDPYLRTLPQGSVGLLPPLVAAGSLKCR